MPHGKVTWVPDIQTTCTIKTGLDPSLLKNRFKKKNMDMDAFSNMIIAAVEQVKNAVVKIDVDV